MKALFMTALGFCLVFFGCSQQVDQEEEELSKIVQAEDEGF